MLTQKIVAFAAILLCASCASVDLSQVRDVADQGQKVADQIDAVVEDSSAAAIDANSTVLHFIHGSLSPSERGAEYEKKTDEITKYLEALEQYRQRSELLAEYMDALGDLVSDSDSSNGEIADDINAMQSGLADTIGGITVANIVAVLSGNAVGRFQSRALREELSANGPQIERALAVQVAFLEALAEGLAADIESSLTGREFLLVASPYVTERTLAAAWLDERQRTLNRAVVLRRCLKQADQAAVDARQLLESWAELLKGTIPSA